MNQESIKTSPSLPSPEQKEAEWKNILSIVFLVLFPLVGLILMWLLTSWSRKTKVIITAALGIIAIIPIIGILASIILVYMGETREAARDMRRKAEMRMIVAAQEMYYGTNDQYYQSMDYPLSIPDFMPKTPTDPLTKGPYGWIDNTRDGQRFCAFADLEKDGFYVATHGGSGEVATEPHTLSDCEKFPGFWR